MVHELTLKILETKTKLELSKELYISIGTIKRWLENGKTPKQYQFDLMKLNKMEIDYSNFSITDKDQFFTKHETVNECWKLFNNKMKELKIDKNDYTFIEPSAGDGAFLKVLPIKTIAFDIEPKNEKIIKQDFLEWQPKLNAKEKFIVFGNPPFGLRGHLALAFINHASKFADFVCFILPQLFESDGKGVPRKRVLNMNLIHSEKLITKFYQPNTEKEVEIHTIFQIWSKNHTSKTLEISHEIETDIKVYSLSDGGTAGSTRNKKMLELCDIYLPSTCFGKENMKLYSTFEELPNRKGYGIIFSKNKEELIEKSKNIDWNTIAFISTNSAINLRTSKIINAFK
jgi:hypothetical protein